jgi:hypothetical protein
VMMRDFSPCRLRPPTLGKYKPLIRHAAARRDT